MSEPLNQALSGAHLTTRHWLHELIISFPRNRVSPTLTCKSDKERSQKCPFSSRAKNTQVSLELGSRADWGALTVTLAVLG